MSEHALEPGTTGQTSGSSLDAGYRSTCQHTLKSPVTVTGAGLIDGHAAYQELLARGLEDDGSTDGEEVLPDCRRPHFY